MAQARKCTTCGAAIPSHAPAGHCPACLLRIGLALGPAQHDAASRAPPSALARIRYVGDYELIEEVASGGMGVVFKARQLSLNRFVAVKMIRAGQFANETEVARFRSEAEAAAQLDHPNIVPIYEVGEQEGQHYFSMKLIEGCNLSEIIEGGGWASAYCPAHQPRSWLAGGRSRCCPTAAQLLARVARAVHYAHQRGLLHRDLKPGNILLDTEGEPHVTDFGLARRVDADSLMTLSGSIVGTPAYMAPEQATGAKALTTAADVYSLGAILYELLAGRPPFVGATVLDTLMQVREREPVPPSVVRSSRRTEAQRSKSEIRNPKPEIDQSLTSDATEKVDRDLETICLKCLQKDPARRYGTAEALAEDLECWLEHRPIRARPVTAVERVCKWTQRKPALAAAVVALNLVVAAGLAGILWQWREASVARGQLSEELWRSHLTRAQAERQTLALGRRTRSLQAIRAAAVMRPARELRDEAAAALALTDLRDTATFCPHPLASGLPEWALDPQCVHLALTAKDAVELRGVADGKTATRLSHDEKNTRFLRFSPDGRSLAVKYFNRDFVVWDVATRQPRFVNRLFKDRADEESFYGFDFSADSRVVGCGDRDGLFHLYDAATGRELHTLRVTNATRPILMARFNPRFESVALAAGNLIEVWTLDGRRLAMRTNLLHAARIGWHPDGATLAYVNWYEPEIVLWNTASGKQRTLRSSQGSQFYLAFAPGGDLLATRGLDGVTRLWDLATEQVILSAETAGALDFSADGTRLGFDRAGVGVGLWEVVRGPVFQNLRHSDATPNVALQTLFSEDGRRLLWRAADGVYGCDVATRAIERGPVGWAHSLSLAESTGALWGATPDGIVHWEDAWKTGARRPQLLRSGPNWRWVSYVPQPRVLAVANETNITVLALPEMNVVFATNVHPSKAWAISPEGSWLAVAVGMHQNVHDEQVLVFDIHRQRQAACLTVNAFALTIDPTCRWLATGSADGCRLWELGNWLKCDASTGSHPTAAQCRWPSRAMDDGLPTVAPPPSSNWQKPGPDVRSSRSKHPNGCNCADWLSTRRATPWPPPSRTVWCSSGIWPPSAANWAASASTGRTPRPVPASWRHATNDAVRAELRRLD